MKIDGEFFIACADAPGFLEPPDALFDHATAAISSAIKLDAPVMSGVLVFLVGNDGPDAPVSQPLADSLDAIRLVACQTAGTKTRPAQRLRNSDRIKQRFNARRFVLLPGSKQGVQRKASAVSNQMEFGAETASAAAQCVIGGFADMAEDTFLSAPPAARAARICVPSTHHKSQSILPSRSRRICKALRIRSKVPSRRQFEKWSYTVCQGPKRSGRSRQGAPVRKIQSIPFHMRRGSLGGRPVRALRWGSSGPIKAHCSSVISCRFILPTPKSIWSSFGNITAKNEFSDRA